MNVAVVSAFNSPAVQLRQPRCVRVAGGGTAAAASGRAGVCRAAQQQAQPAAAQQQQQDQKLAAMATSRRRVLALPAGLAAAAALAAGAGPAAAIVIPPPGYRYHVDKLDGYSFFYPADWSVVTVGAPRGCACMPRSVSPPTVHPRCCTPAQHRPAGAAKPATACPQPLRPAHSQPLHPPALAHPQTSGNDVQYRNPFNVEENLFVNVSSPSSSKYESVADLGSPMDAAKKLQSQVGAAWRLPAWSWMPRSSSRQMWRRRQAGSRRRRRRRQGALGSRCKCCIAPLQRFACGVHESPVPLCRSSSKSSCAPLLRCA